MIDLIQNIDSNILLWIQNNIRNDILTPVFTTITHLGDAGFIWIVISILLVILKKTRKAGILCVATLLVSTLVNNLILKNLVCRVRPYEVVGGLTRVIEKQSDYSFPSGHTAASFAVAITIYQCVKNKKYGIITIIFAFLMGFSRLYVGVHYITDVLAAMIISTIISIVIVKINHKYNIVK